MKDQKYDPSKIEPKWQKVWAREKLYATPEGKGERGKGKGKGNKYVLDMFPYPSGAGLHVGHMEGYVATDVVSRYLRMKGFAVLHPMGWDAFGLPAENYAIKTGTPPGQSTPENVKNFKYQLNLLGLSYDWSREIDTSSPNYYKWTQWLFIEFFKRGLAYKKKAPANFCPKDETVLANEQVVDGKCDRCGTEVIQKELDQWFFKITDYADKLIEGLDKIDWPESTKVQQVNWIGRSEGAEIEFALKGSDRTIRVFSTAQDTIFGATFIVLAPEYAKALISEVPSMSKAEVVKYIEASLNKKEQERKEDEKLKTGVDTGIVAINPFSGSEIPVYVADYVLMGYGTGAIMGVPGHDKRDNDFAKKFGLKIIYTTKPVEEVLEQVEIESDGFWDYAHIKAQFLDTSILFNSGFLDGLTSRQAKKKIEDELVKRGIGKKVTTYHIRDWLISRQRYWGAPIPMIWCDTHEWQPVPESELPVLLPTDVGFEPHGESPIASSKTFQKGVKCPVCGGPGKREVDTMDTYVDSSWYFYRFTDPKNDTAFASKTALEQWIPVDVYVGGGHVVQHLLFCRFFHKVLVDAGYIKNDGTNEPMLKLRAPGWILGPDSRKMSKRWGNIITPEEVVTKHGADTMRVYEMFMAPFEVDKPWNVNSVAGVERFLSRIYDLFDKTYQAVDISKVDPDLNRSINKLIIKVAGDIEGFRFNTAISSMMEFLNQMSAEPNKLNRSVWEKFLLVLAPFAPHVAEELYQRLGKRGKGKVNKFVSIHQQSWPEVEEKYLVEDKVKVAVSINGKVRAILEMEPNKAQSEVETIVKGDARVIKFLEDKTIKKIIYVPGKIINFVV